MLNISKQIYAGWDLSYSGNILPEAEVIPLGESVNEKRKINKITSKYSSIKEFDNIPLPGFTLSENNRKNWGSKDETWLIVDPRGFFVRISNDNLNDILHVTGITEGLIQEKCVWAREDSKTDMMLVPISSELYLKASKNTELLEDKISIKDVQIGDKVLLQSGLTGTYMGVLSLYGTLTYSYSNKDYSRKPQTYLRRQVCHVGNDRYYYHTDIKILKVLEKREKPVM